MKKILFCLVFLLISRFSYSQFYLGLKISEAYEAIRNNPNNEIFKEGIVKGKFTIFWQDLRDKSLYSLYFNDNGLSNKYFFTMGKATDALATVHLYDRVYNIIEKGHWYLIQDKKLIHIEFTVNPDYSHVFYVHY